MFSFVMAKRVTQSANGRGLFRRFEGVRFHIVISRPSLGLDFFSKVTTLAHAVAREKTSWLFDEEMDGKEGGAYLEDGGVFTATALHVPPC